jgi:hypothetical protein
MKKSLMEAFGSLLENWWTILVDSKDLVEDFGRGKIFSGSGEDI